MHGFLGEAEARAIEAHIADCDGCGQVVAEAARALVGADGEGAGAEGAGELPDEPEIPAPRRLAAGDRLGRYVILDVVGRGAMGVVYTAYDPELDRRVALKILRADRRLGAGADELQERLLREGRAMARVSHPNIVAVHDVGSVGDGTFLAMELVEGQTLRAWLSAERRSARAVLDAFRDAGRGLAAAHRVGLVHRDFKPENVLVGRDGRVRVTDFGLARRDDAEVDPGAPPGSPPPAALSLTATGAVVGTPAYMAPEQLRGESAGVAADVFSFCAALWQALYGGHPFPADSFSALREAVLSRDPVEPPAGAGVPAHVLRALRRGLRRDPAERFASMDELLAALDADPVRRAKRIAAVALPLVVAVLAVAALAVSARRGRVACDGGRARVAAVWSAPRREALRSGLLATGAPHAADATGIVEHALDAFGDRWAAGYRDACEATHARGEQSPALLDRRMQCLDERLRELDALVDAMSHADRAVLDRAPAAAFALRPVDACADRARLLALAPPPDDPAARARLDAARAALARARAQGHAGRYRDGIAAAREALEQARAAGYGPLEADARGELGDLLRRADDLGEAQAEIERALVAAVRAGHDEAAIRAKIALSSILGVHRQTDEMLRWSTLAEAEIERLGNDASLRATLLSSRGMALILGDRVPAARPVLEEAVAVLRRRHGDAHPGVASAMSRLGQALFKAGLFADALPWLEKAAAIDAEVLGPEHPDTADAVYNAASAHSALGRRRLALEMNRKVLAARERQLGPEHRALGLVLTNIGQVESELGLLAEAGRSFDRATTILEKALGPDHPELVNVLALRGLAWAQERRLDDALASCRRAQRIAEARFGAEGAMMGFVLLPLARALEEADRRDEALATYDRAIALLTRAAPDHPDLAFPLLGRGRVLLREGRLDDAQASVDRALALTEKALGPQHSDVAVALVDVGEARMARREHEEARAAFDRAVKILEGAELDPLTVAEARLGLSRALGALGAEPARAATLLAEARRVILASPYARPELVRRAR